MRRIGFTRRNRSGNLLHIETEGGIVNIQVGLTDTEGHPVTSVRIIPDDETRGGDGDGLYWKQDGSRLIGYTLKQLRAADPREAFSVGETVIIRDTSDGLDAIGDITVIHRDESGFPVSADVDVDGALHRVALAGVRHL